ncbi:MAG TPA: hypothetical protein VNI78_06050, partial [Vicinamibacterales bacterium]|nr:hypothetical protein [Vicinamibacterales bacterium]
AAELLGVRRANVGDVGFTLEDVDLAMSPICARLIRGLDLDEIRRRRRRNYALLDRQLDPRVRRVFPGLDDGVCPLFFPILADDKPAAARALRRAGVDALEFWNDSAEGGGEMAAGARFLRRHVLELPIHQDVSDRQIAHIARQVNRVVRSPA